MTKRISVRVEKPNTDKNQVWWFGRNGSAQNWGIAAWGNLEDRVFLELLCSQGALSGAGGFVESEVLDEFCRKWLEARASQAPNEHEGGIGDVAYTQNSGHCPYCGSVEIEGDDWEVDGDRTTQEVSCNACGRRWYDLYQLAGYHDRDEGPNSGGCGQFDVRDLLGQTNVPV